MFTMAPYAQLILEAAKLYDIEDEIINQMFSFYVTDMATYATKQLSSQENGEGRDALLLEIINTKPVHDKAEYDRIWTRPSCPSPTPISSTTPLVTPPTGNHRMLMRLPAGTPERFPLSGRQALPFPAKRKFLS